MAKSSTTTKKPDGERRQWVLFRTWTDVPPELIHVIDGTEAECEAWKAGYESNSGKCHDGGTPATLEEILADPEGHGVGTDPDSY